MTSPFDEFEVGRGAASLSARGLPFDLDQALASLVILQARVPGDAFTARTLGSERWGNGIVIGTDGLVLTIGYLITEAEEVTLIANDGRRVPAHVLGYDQATGFGLVHALETFGPAIFADAAEANSAPKLQSNDPIILAGGGGLAHAIAGRLIARAPFAGHWEYMLEEALFTGPGHPHWSGAALIGPTGALMGVASLQMNQEVPSGESTIINMSVPIELLPPILDDLSRGRLGRSATALVEGILSMTPARMSWWRTAMLKVAQPTAPNCARATSSWPSPAIRWPVWPTSIPSSGPSAQPGSRRRCASSAKAMSSTWTSAQPTAPRG